MACKQAREQIEHLFQSSDTHAALTEHLAKCGSCRRLFEERRLLQNAITQLRSETSHVSPSRQVEQYVLAAANQPGLQLAGTASNTRSTMRRYNVRFKVWAAFAVALMMSMVGSALVYQVAKLLTVSTHVDTAQVQAGVLVFWLLPSLCSALWLLAAPRENRGIA